LPRYEIIVCKLYIYETLIYFNSN